MQKENNVSFVTDLRVNVITPRILPRFFEGAVNTEYKGKRSNKNDNIQQWPAQTVGARVRAEE